MNKVEAKVLMWTGKTLRIRQELMKPGWPYHFVFEGVSVIAIKRWNGDVDIFENEEEVKQAD